MGTIRRLVLQSEATMNPDDEICYCYHVSMRKLVNFARRTKPKRPSQMSECLSAGTGCGWCIPFLVKIANEAGESEAIEMTPEEYAESRKAYITTHQPKNRF
jgi:bacterioferritin-associated ferredoxin